MEFFNKPFEKAEKATKEKKKNRKEHQLEDSTPVTRSNIENSAAKKHKKAKNITCYNYNKKGHYANKFLESKKSQN